MTPVTIIVNITVCWLMSALEPLQLIMQKRMYHKLMNIMDNTAHPT